MDTKQPLLKINNITKDYGTSNIVKDISFEIKENEIMTLLGPSGCGKTTTLRMVSGLEPITSGEIICRGKVLDCSSSKPLFRPTNETSGWYSNPMQSGHR